MIEDYIRDEIFYREGRAAGLDRDDVIIRRRVRQKMEFLAEDMAAAEPTEEQLAAFLASNPERFRTEDRLTFHQFFLNATRRGERIGRRRQADRGDPCPRAKPRLIPRRSAIPSCSATNFAQMPQRDIARTFGDGFAKQLSGRRTGAVARADRVELRSSISSLSTNGRRGSVPPLDAVRRGRQREWPNARRIEAEQKLYRTLRDRYEIVVEKPRQGRSTRSDAMKRLAFSSAFCLRCLRIPARRTSFGPAIWNCAKPRPTPTACCSRSRHGRRPAARRSTSACPRARRM